VFYASCGNRLPEAGLALWTKADPLEVDSYPCLQSRKTVLLAPCNNVEMLVILCFFSIHLQELYAAV